MHYSIPVRRMRGFSLVEIMVGIAIGLLGVLIIMQVSVVFEGQKRTTTTGADAQTNGVSALYAVERDVRKAGYGFGAAAGCTVKISYNGTPVYNGTSDPLLLAPVVITDGTDGAPDTIRVMASAKSNWSLPNRLTVDHPADATSMFLNTTLGIQTGDLLVAYEPLKPSCTLLQVTDVPTDSNVQIVHETSSKWNPSGGVDIYPLGGYDVGALIFNMGSLLDHTYALKNDDPSGTLTLSEYDSSTNTSTVRAITSDIVNIQAAYGFDTRPGVQTSPIVSDDGWRDTMIDADGGDTNGDDDDANDPGDIARIVAIRIAVVARSPLQEKPNAAGVCDITIDTAVGSRAANAPAWHAKGTEELIPIDVKKNPDGSANPNWKCYRYKTFETVIPLRNLLWGHT